jgi:Tfp pilus assembly protein PilF
MKRLLAVLILVLAAALVGWPQPGAAQGERVQEAMKRAARDYIKHGLILATENRHEEAVKSFEQAIGMDPTSAEAYSLLGSTFAKLGKYREAEENLRKAVQLDPNYGEGYYYLGLFLKERGKEQEAAEALRKARQSPR